jgi:tyrosyl-tRNA synthetase
MVVFNKLKTFQDLGHTAILLIGDYTAMIGDPSGRSATRPVLTEKEVAFNSKTYLEQAFKILDPEKTIVRRNSEWLNKLSCADLLNLARKMTVAQMIEREDFHKRFTEQTPISIVEFLYPLLQGYDSVALESDVEIGGNDQLFNMLVGRVLQKDAGQSEQAVICMPLLVGLDGERKMSKSYDNYVAFNDSPENMFGKIMSIPDALMRSYFQLLLGESDADLKAHESTHPMEMKKELAFRLTQLLHCTKSAHDAQERFETIFSRKEIPSEMPSFSLKTLHLPQNSLLDVIAATHLVDSKKEIKRLCEQGAIKINQQKMTDLSTPIPQLTAAQPLVFQIGKRVFFRLVP